LGRFLALLALASSVAVGALLTTTVATILTLDGDALPLVAVGIGLCGAVIVPLAVGSGIVRSLERRGRAIRRTPVLGLSMLLLHVATAGALYAALPDVVATAEAGVERLVPTPPDPDAPAPITIEQREPAPGTTVEVVAAQRALSALLSGHVDGLASLSDESAAAVGVAWMRMLSAQHPGGLADRAPAELLAAVHQGLRPTPDLWADPAGVEAVVVPRGRVFLADVARLADHLTPRDGVGRLVWPLLPPAWVGAQARGESPAFSADYKRVERDRMHVTIAGDQRTLLRQEGEWRLDLGPFGEITSARPDPRSMWLALTP
jgi:hypothetical protein